jgi:hypothetical protein
MSTRFSTPGQVISLLLTALFLAGLIADDAITVLAAPPPQRHVCEINLHQGDAGQLEIRQMADGIQGTLTLERQAGGEPLATSIRGSWTGDVIRFTRRLSSTSEQQFIGIVVAAGDSVVKMAGRYADAHEGVWSATCARSGLRLEGGGPPPPVSTQTADAPQRTADPPKPPTSNTCSISGAAIGPRAGLANVYQVLLRGPNSLTAVRGRQPFGTGHFTFRDLPDGNYVLTVDTKADVAVNVSPRRHDIVCAGGHIVGKNFQFQ